MIDPTLNNGGGLSYQFYPTDQDIFRRIDAMPTYDAPSRSELKGAAQWIRSAIDFVGYDILQLVDFDSLQYLQARVRIYREMQFKPKQYTAADCGVLSSYRTAIEAKKTQLVTDKANYVIDERWFNIYTNVLNDVANHINFYHGSLACDVVLPQQKQEKDAETINKWAEDAMKDNAGSGINYITISIVAIVLIVVIVVIKKLRNG